MVKEKKKMFSVSFPLKTEKWQEDILEKRFNIARNLYNELIKITSDRLFQMKQTKEYREAYLIENKKERSKVYNDLLRKYRLSEFDFIADMSKLYKIYNKNIDSLTANILAKRVWNAHRACLFMDGKYPHFKRKGEMKSLSSNSNKSGIRIRGNNLIWKDLIIPIVIPGTPYEKWALEHEVVYPTIVKKSTGYYVQILFRGTPDNKGRKPGKGIVSIVFDLSSLYITTESGFRTIRLPRINPSIESDIIKLQNKLNRSRKQLNPDNYNEDGTIKKGALNWNYSKRYLENRKKLQRLHERAVGQRKNLYYSLVNEIIELGDEFYVLKPDYSEIKRKSESNTKVQQYIKKNQRKKLQKYAPYMVYELLEKKLSYFDLELNIVPNEMYDTAMICSSCGCLLQDNNSKGDIWVCNHCGENNSKWKNISLAVYNMAKIR